jgi:DNA-binding GntR family transcriptional regulator
MRQPTTLHAEVYRRLRSMIWNRELAPGTKLVLRNLASQLNTSTMPVLEAVRALERDGLVTQIPKWGAYVTEWTEHEQLEALHLRRALEGEAARLFVTRASPEQKQELIRVNAAFDQAAALDVMDGLDADVALHLHIARSTGFKRLAQLVELAKLPLAMMMRSFHINGGKQPSLNLVGCHATLVHHLLGNDPELGCRTMWDHIDGTIRAINTDHEEVSEIAGTTVPQSDLVVR